VNVLSPHQLYYYIHNSRELASTKC